MAEGLLGELISSLCDCPLAALLGWRAGGHRPLLPTPKGWIQPVGWERGGRRRRRGRGGAGDGGG